MRLYLHALCVIALAGMTPADADHAPGFVVPGRSDVPVVIDGIDVSWGVVEGDWGLHRPGAPPHTIIPAPVAIPRRGGAVHYFPSEGLLPRSGRVEIEPPANRRLPPPAESFHRSWGAASDPAPATIPSDPPPVIVAPGDYDYGRRRRRHHH